MSLLEEFNSEVSRQPENLNVKKLSGDEKHLTKFDGKRKRFSLEVNGFLRAFHRQKKRKHFFRFHLRAAIDVNSNAKTRNFHVQLSTA